MRTLLLLAAGGTTLAGCGGGAAPAGLEIAEDICVDPAAGPRVAVAHSSRLVAFVTCGPSGGRVVVFDVATATETEIATGADASFEVAFSPDDLYVVYGGAGALSIRPVDGTGDPVALSADPVADWRFIDREDRSIPDTFHSTILIAGSAGRDVRVTARSADDPAGAFSTETELVRGPVTGGALDLVSEDGLAMFVLLDDMRYHRAATDGSEPAAPLGFGPAGSVLVPPGLGHTHAIARIGDGLAFRSLDTDAETVLFAEHGVLPDERSLFMRPDPGERDEGFLYYVQDGDPHRFHRLEGVETAPERLRQDDATALAMIPDGTFVVYPSGSDVVSLPSSGGDPIAIVEGFAPPAAFVVVFSPDSHEVAVLDRDGGLLRAPASAAGGAEALEASGASAPGFAGDSGALLWLRGGELRAAPRGTRSAGTIANDADAWWSVPGHGDVLYLSRSGTLRSITPR